jgi:hypothetical protein
MSQRLAIVFLKMLQKCFINTLLGFVYCVILVLLPLSFIFQSLQLFELDGLKFRIQPQLRRTIYTIFNRFLLSNLLPSLQLNSLEVIDFIIDWYARKCWDGNRQSGE